MPESHAVLDCVFFRLGKCDLIIMIRLSDPEMGSKTCLKNGFKRVPLSQFNLVSKKRQYLIKDKARNE